MNTEEGHYPGWTFMCDTPEFKLFWCHCPRQYFDDVHLLFFNWLFCCQGQNHIFSSSDCWEPWGNKRRCKLVCIQDLRFYGSWAPGELRHICVAWMKLLYDYIRKGTALFTLRFTCCMSSPNDMAENKECTIRWWWEQLAQWVEVMFKIKGRALASCWKVLVLFPCVSRSGDFKSLISPTL